MISETSTQINTQHNIEITVFRKADGILSKRIAMKDGKVKTDGSHCRMTEGEARAVRLKGVKDLAQSHREHGVGSSPRAWPTTRRFTRSS